MKIGIVLHPYAEKNPGGLGRAIFELAKALIERGAEHEFFVFIRGRKPAPDFPGSNWRPIFFPEGAFWLDRGFARTPALDACIISTPIMPFWHQPERPVVVAYDFAYLGLPYAGIRDALRRQLLRLWHGFSLRAARHIVAVSKATKKDIVSEFGIAPEKVSVIYLGLNHICATPPQPVPVPEKFFLFVGAVKERKNVLALVRAFEKFRTRNPAYALAIAGKEEGKYAAAVRRWVDERGITDSVRFLGYVSDAELSFLYHRASALVFPSVAEGFTGFPVFEAMDCGLPVITSSSTPFTETEADRDAALRVDPRDTGAIAEAMERIASDPELRTRLILKGHECVSRFSWKKTAEEFLRLIESDL